MADSGCEDTVPSMAPSACKLPEESDATMRARLFNSLSQSFPHSQLYKALHGGEDIILNGGGGDNSEDDDDSLYGDHLSNSCFASLRMEPRDSDDMDDDLCSLEWLQNEDLLKNIGGQKLDGDEEEGTGGEQKENEDVKPDLNLLQNGVAGAGQPQPHFPYHPQKHVNSKPPYSFSCLIFMAVENSPKKMLPVKDIYNWILTQFPYFQNAPTGWKNSVRHNLSLNKCFKKVEKDKGQSIGKGSLWCIDPAYRPNLLQALRKTPYHPYHQLQMTSTQPQNYMQYQSLPGGCRPILPLTQRPVPNTVSPHLFPFLSRRLAQTPFHVDNEMKDVAQTLVALKAAVKKESPDNSPGEDIGPTWKYHKRSYSYNNPRRRPSSPVVVTGHPYGDHAYSSTRLLEDEDDDDDSPSSSSSIDEEYDFGDADDGESDYQSDMDWGSDEEEDKDEVDGDLPPNTKKLKIDLSGSSSSGKAPAKGGSRRKVLASESEDEEQKKLHEGANALLNLAGLLLNNRPSAPRGKDSSGSGSSRRKQSEEKKKMKKKNIVKVKKKKMLKASPGKKIDPKGSGEKVSRKRQFSKRKNAGSNAKYDSDEYALGKPTKNLSNGRASSKSPTEKRKAPLSPTKTKELATGPSGNKVRKPLQAKRKLKLSKDFGSKKPSASVTKGNSTFGNKKEKKLKLKHDIKAKSATKKQPKSISASGDKTHNRKVGAENKEQDEAAHPHSPATKVQDIEASVDQTDSSVKVPAPQQPPAHNNNNTTSKMDAPVVTPAKLSNGELLTPAGDAPVASVPEDNPPLSNLAAQHFCSSTGDEERKPTTPSKGALLLSASTNNGSHKSPHFTRFSKKKGAIS